MLSLPGVRGKILPEPGQQPERIPGGRVETARIRIAKRILRMDQVAALGGVPGRRRGEAVQSRELLLGVIQQVVDSVAAPDDQLVAELVSEAEARRPVVVVGVPQSAIFAAGELEPAQQRQAGLLADRIRHAEIEPTELVVALGARALRLPAKTEIEREPFAHAPGVLKVNPEVGRVHGGRHVGVDAARRSCPQQHAGDCVSGDRAVGRRHRTRRHAAREVKSAGADGQHVQRKPLGRESEFETMGAVLLAGVDLRAVALRRSPVLAGSAERVVARRSERRNRVDLELADDARRQAHRPRGIRAVSGRQRQFRPPAVGQQKIDHEGGLQHKCVSHRGLVSPVGNVRVAGDGIGRIDGAELRILLPCVAHVERVLLRARPVDAEIVAVGRFGGLARVEPVSAEGERVARLIGLRIEVRNLGADRIEQV